MSVSLSLVERHVRNTALLILTAVVLNMNFCQIMADTSVTSWIVIAVLLCGEREYVIFNAVSLCFLNMFF